MLYGSNLCMAMDQYLYHVAGRWTSIIIHKTQQFYDLFGDGLLAP